VTFGELFGGIGGFSLGFERAGLTKRWSVEIDPYCQRVLRKHWPNCGEWDDVRTFPPDPAEDWRVDVIAGGFPCQDISNAGPRVGIEGSRSGLWSEFSRIIRVLRPRFVVVENVPEITLPRGGLGVVLGDLASMGFDAEWGCLPAAAFGAPHIRERFFAVAYSETCDGGRIGRRKESTCRHSGPCWNADRNDAQARVYEPKRARIARAARCWGTDQPGLDRASYGVPNRVHRLRALGNAVVPQVAQWLGERLMECSQ
jgi:DNA (cytosine-5)-methyltransferase 1